MTVEQAVHRRASGAAGALVGDYWGYRTAGAAPAVHRGLPSPSLTLVLALDDALHVVAHPDPRQPGGRYDALVGGLHTRPALIAHHGRQAGVQIALSPLHARALLGIPAGELASLDVHGEDLLGPRVPRLLERLHEQTSWTRRFDVLDAALASWLLDVPGPPAEVAGAWDVLVARAGAVRVEALARHVGWSTRHLAKRFRAETGLSVKEAARVVRFDVPRRPPVRPRRRARLLRPSAPRARVPRPRRPSAERLAQGRTDRIRTRRRRHERPSCRA